MLDSFGKQILLTFFRGIVHLDPTEQVDFNKWRGHISKRGARLKADLLEYLNVASAD